MKPLFVDTAGWMMLADGSDHQHHEAVACRDRWLESGGRFVSTDYVMDETLTLLRFRLGLEAAEKWWAQVSASDRVGWQWIDPARAEKARHWLFRWKDKDFSFTDCTSFVVMKEQSLREALTSDEHFTQAGFRTLPD